MTHYLNNLNAVPELPNAVVIRYPHFQKLHEQIQECLQMRYITGEPHCMSLEGPTGAGKTTLIMDYLSHLPRTEVNFGTQIDALYVPVPDNPTIKTMVAQMLEYLKDPAYDKMPRLWEAKSRLKHFIRQCQVKLILLDDFQHLIRSNYTHMQDLSEWLKALIKETGVCMIVVGTEGAVEAVLDSNQQLSRLFAAREILPAFVWDDNDEESVRIFAALISKAEETLDMPIDDEQERVELLGRIYYVSNGVMGNVMNFLRLANLLALKAGKERIDQECMDEAFERRLKKHMKSKSNPFKHRLSKPFVPVEILVNPEAAKSEKARRISDVLSSG